MALASQLIVHGEGRAGVFFGVNVQILREWEQAEEGTAHTFVHLEMEHHGRIFEHKYHRDALKFGGMETIRKNALKRAWGEVRLRARRT